MDKILAEIHSYVASRVAEGFDSKEAIIEQATECFEDEHQRDDLGPHAERITVKLLNEHRRAQTQWTFPTDCDKLDKAFAELDRGGIVARQNFTCCQTCGHSEIGDEIKQARAYREIHGYVFYHMQDTEQACASGHLYLAYGSVEEGEEPIANVGKRIVETLQRQGLRTDWNGSHNERVLVVGLDWKRRRS